MQEKYGKTQKEVVRDEWGGDLAEEEDEGEVDTAEGGGEATEGGGGEEDEGEGAMESAYKKVQKEVLRDEWRGEGGEEAD